ncbi:hypothetical protein CFS9_32330 [Flavobacterium sp. CFS9]|uniref:Linear amide C-N hydrolases, choloylglycine hydrolase family n=1 Tax=Flavobacterium sp. CFS9 TaxID=3143118 RepID=A0AAT9H537_9FLAO
MRQKISKISLVLILLLTHTNFTNACTIFMANDSKHVWIGNNEDESVNMKYRFWYFKKSKKNYGYMSWSELHPTYESIMYQYPQGGLNEYGLFMDYTAIDEIPVIRNFQKTDREKEVINDILRTCKTVDEALRYINGFNLIKLSAAQLFIGDATGDYATVHGNYIVRKTTPCFALTNYSINNNHTQHCWRRETAYHYLQKEKKFDLTDITQILSKTAQKPQPGDDIATNYSMAIDLKKQKIYLYLKRDYTRKIVISLSKQLKKNMFFEDLGNQLK